MARGIRKKSGTGIYHIMLRGINRQDIFEEDDDYLQMTYILDHRVVDHRVGSTDRFSEQMEYKQRCKYN